MEADAAEAQNGERDDGVDQEVQYAGPEAEDRCRYGEDAGGFVDGGDGGLGIRREVVRDGREFRIFFRRFEGVEVAGEGRQFVHGQPFGAAFVPAFGFRRDVSGFEKGDDFGYGNGAFALLVFDPVDFHGVCVAS